MNSRTLHRVNPNIPPSAVGVELRPVALWVGRLHAASYVRSDCSVAVVRYGSPAARWMLSIN